MTAVGEGRSVCGTAQKDAFRAWPAHQMRNPAHPGAAGNHREPKPPKTLAEGGRLVYLAS